MNHWRLTSKVSTGRLNLTILFLDKRLLYAFETKGCSMRQYQYFQRNVVQTKKNEGIVNKHWNTQLEKKPRWSSYHIPQNIFNTANEEHKNENEKKGRKLAWKVMHDTMMSIAMSCMKVITKRQAGVWRRGGLLYRWRVNVVGEWDVLIFRKREKGINESLNKRKDGQHHT